MIGALSRYRRRLREIRLERQRLSQLPIAAINAASLNKIDAPQLSCIFKSASITKEWNEVSAQLDRIVHIEDMKTEGVNPGDRRALYYLIRELKCKRVLEIGSNVGASTLSIAAALQRNMSADNDPECGIVSVDIHDVNDAPDAPWKIAKLTGAPRDNLTAIGMASYVTFETKSSLSYFESCREQFDFIFLDGDHAASTVYQEIPKALSALRQNGTILLHDYFPRHRPLWNDYSVIPGPLLACERLKREGAKLKVLPLKLPWPTKLGTNITSLAIVSSE